MSKTTINFNIRMDDELKKKAETLFAELGMSMTTACNIFFRQAVRQGKIPFEISLDLPNAETVSAMREVEQMIKNGAGKRYDSVDKLFEDLNS